MNTQFSISKSISKAALLIVLALAKTMAAQRNCNLEIVPSFGWLARQDIVFSPLVHRSSSPLDVQLIYRKSKKWETAWQLSFAQFTDKKLDQFDYRTPTEPDKTERSQPHGFTFIDLNFSAGKNLFKTQNSKLVLGGSLAADLDAMNYQFARAASFGYFMAFDAAVFGRWQRELATRHCFAAEFRVPLLAWVARSPYLVNDDEFIENTASHRPLHTLIAFAADGDLALPDRFLRLALAARYDFLLSEKLKIGCGFRGDWLRHSHPLPLHAVRNSVFAALVFNF